MRLRRKARALTSWIAGVAILMAALAPSISHALRSNDAPSWIEVCSSTGAKWVRPDGVPDRSHAPAGAHRPEHCPYCSLHANTLAIPPAAVSLPPGTSFAFEAAPVFLPAPRTHDVWVSALPRAPPPHC